MELIYILQGVIIEGIKEYGYVREAKALYPFLQIIPELWCI